jgi:hypothetical protein
VRNRERRGTAARRLQVDLEGVEQHGEHGEVPQAADEVDNAWFAELLQGRGERGVRHEVLTENLGAELVGDFLIPAGEARFLVSASGCRLSRDTPASIALPTCAFQEYCASKWRAAMSRLSSRSRRSSEDSKQQ